MPDFDKVSRGQMLALSAVELNAMLEVGEAHRRRAFAPGGNGLNRVPVSPALSVFVKNVLDSAVPIYGVVGLGDPVMSVEEVPHENRRRPGFAATAPDANRPFGILIEPAAPQAIVPAVVNGITVARVNLSNLSHGFATLGSSTDHLVSGPSGPVQLLWKPSATGVAECLVLIGITTTSTARQNYVLPPFCAETVNDAYGNPVTTIKRVVRRQDGAVVCLPMKICCPAEYYCVYNRLLSTVVGACCGSSTPIANRFTATSVMRVRFADKTGFATDPECGLPDGIFLYSDDGLTWTGGGTFTMGGTTFTGGVTVACVEGVLKVTWGVSGFTGTTPVNIPCELTSTETDLGTFTVALKRCKPCDPTVDAPPATVRIYISSTLDEDEEPESPLKVEAGWVPPWFFNGGPFETLEDAEQCCPFGFLTAASCHPTAGIEDPENPPEFTSTEGYLPFGRLLTSRLNLYFHSGTGSLAGANGMLTWHGYTGSTPGDNLTRDYGYAPPGTPATPCDGISGPNTFTIPGTSVTLKCGLLTIDCYDGRNIEGQDPMPNFFSKYIAGMEMFNGSNIYRATNTTGQGGSFGPDPHPYFGVGIRLKHGPTPQKHTFVITGTPTGSCLVDFYL